MRALRPWWLLLALASCGDDSLPPSSAQDRRFAAEAYARDDLACQTADDCCVVVDSCVNRALVVAASERAEVEQLLAEASDGACTRCVAPAVQVTCVQGLCVGTSVSPTDDAARGALSQTHCGSVALPESSGAQMYVFGCGG